MASLASAAQQQSGLPGFTLPLNYVPPGWLNPFRTRLLYPHALQETEESTKVYREILMMRVMNTITEKQDWNKKIFNEEIISKWREEILNSGQDISPKMMDYIVKELQWKSKLIETDGFITAFDKGVVKSDTAVPEELRKALADAVAPLEDVPDDQKDYHPGSDQKVIDLVHPSLFPLIYGHTRILRNELVTLENCIGTTGQGELLPAFSESSDERWMPGVERDFYSRKFQWLPCNVELSATESAEPECRIVSYINNLHPAKHRTLYGVIEKIISCAIPLWNRSLAGEGSMNRIMYEVVEYDEESLGPPPEQEPNEPEDDFSERCSAWESSAKIIMPEPEDFKEHKFAQESPVLMNFGKTGLQVIVKLANIELSPEKPEYDGGSWHIEGQLNEHICATAIYYYDSENITESTLAFRQRTNGGALEECISYPQDRHEFLQVIYGLDADVTGSSSKAQITQELGGVICRQGRLLTFPNVVQHRVAPFSLDDRSRPGHRKILALFLVDPHIKIISTANVPPQQEDWGKEKEDLTQELLSKRLPVELGNMVCDEGLLQPLMTMEEAKKFRLELMEERAVDSQVQNDTFEKYSFSLCEH